jgi:hypothetical protein
MKVDFSVYQNDRTAPYVMAYRCSCGRLSVAFGADMKGLFVGVCEARHDVTITAS